MLLPFVLFFAYFNGFTSAISNDIVGSLRCKLMCKEVRGIAHELTANQICKCKITEELRREDLGRVQDLSVTYKLPLMLLLDRSNAHQLYKRQIDNSILDDLQAKLDEHKQQWDDTFDTYRTWRQQQAEQLFGDFDLEAFKEKSAAQVEPIVAQIAPILEEQRQQWGANLEKLKSWKDEHLENLEPVLGNIAPDFEEQQQKLEENLEKLRAWQDQPMAPELDKIMPNFDDHQQQLAENFDKIRSWQEEHVQPLLEKMTPNLEEKRREWEEGIEKFRSWAEENSDHNEPVLGQMAPSLTTYDSKATGIGGSNVNFPPPNHPNPFIPPLAHIINALPVPRFNVGGGGAPVAAAAPPPWPIMPPFPSVQSRSAISLPEKFRGPYNPNNPIVVRPVVLPPQEGDQTPKPILGALANSVGDLVKNMKKNGGRLIPENYMNSDALSNSESQVNQINVNVRFEPTPTPPNLYSMFMPWNGRNWLLAPAPKGVETDEVTENPGKSDEECEDAWNTDDDNKQKEQDKVVDSDREEALRSEDDEDEEDIEEEKHMQSQLRDVDDSQFSPHLIDSVKKNLQNPNQRFAPNDYYNNGIIVQPKELIHESDEDIETLAK